MLMFDNFNDSLLYKAVGIINTLIPARQILVLHLLRHSHLMLSLIYPSFNQTFQVTNKMSQ